MDTHMLKKIKDSKMTENQAKQIQSMIFGP